MSKSTAKKVIVFKLETTYSTDPTPTAADGIAVSNVNFAPAANVAKRDRAHATYGGDKHVLTQQNGTLSFDVELAGAGVAGDVPLYGKLLRACGMLETVTEDTKVEYTPVSAAQENGTAYFNWDGLLHKMTGGRGSVSWKLDGGGLPMMSFSFTGLFSLANVTDVAAIDVTDALASFIDSIEVNNANTQFSLHGFAAVLNTLQINLGNTVTFRDRPNAAKVSITNRPDCGGNLVIDAVAVASKNYFASAGNGTTGALALTHGTVAGNIIKLDAPVLQLEVPSYTDINGELGLSSAFGLKRTDGDDEIKLTVM